jgi:hypothetical protein
MNSTGEYTCYVAFTSGTLEDTTTLSVFGVTVKDVEVCFTDFHFKCQRVKNCMFKPEDWQATTGGA